MMTIKVILILVIFLNLILSVFILAQNTKALSNRTFSLLSFLAAIWTFTHYMLNISQSVYWFTRIYALGSLVISTGLIWTIIITEKSISVKKILIIFLTALLFFIFSIQPGFITQLSNKDHITITSMSNPGWGLTLYTIYYAIFALLIIWKLYNAQKTTNDNIEKSRFRFILIGALVSLIASAFTSFIIPFSTISLSGALDSIGFLIFLLFIAFAITKHSLFNIKVIAIQIIVLFLWIFLIFHIIIETDPRQIVIKLITLFIALIFGIILIRSVLYNIKQDKKIEKLTNDLNNAYSDINNLNQQKKLTRNGF